MAYLMMAVCVCHLAYPLQLKDKEKTNKEVLCGLIHNHRGVTFFNLMHLSNFLKDLQLFLYLLYIAENYLNHEKLWIQSEFTLGPQGNCVTDGAELYSLPYTIRFSRTTESFVAQRRYSSFLRTDCVVM